MEAYEATDMVVTLGPGGNRLGIKFEVKGTPLVQDRARMNTQHGQPYLYDPSSSSKRAFAAAVRREMASIGANNFPFFDDRSALLLTEKFVLPRPKKDFVKNKIPRQLVPDASTFPRGKDVDNLSKFVTDALQGTLYLNDTIIVREVEEKTYPTDISEDVGWTEVEFCKVAFSDPTNLD
jgi:Holliday junction resolvase RusA-like endonuclease